MQKEAISECTDLAKQYLASSGDKKNNVRNALYFKMQLPMNKWIQSVLSQKKVFLSKEELLSVNYECFEFCLNRFKPNAEIPLPNHFYAYTKFFLAMNCGQHNEIVCVNLADKEIGESLDLAYEHIDELREFRKTLPNEYWSVYDDAIMSLVDSRQNRLRRLDESPLTYQKYCESKRIFKLVIDYLLRR